VRELLETSFLDIVSLLLIELVVKCKGWLCCCCPEVEDGKRRWQFDTRNLKVNFIEVKQTLHFHCVPSRLGDLV
jgi:hypothetical protein